MYFNKIICEFFMSLCFSFVKKKYFTWWNFLSLFDQKLDLSLTIQENLSKNSQIQMQRDLISSLSYQYIKLPNGETYAYQQAGSAESQVLLLLHSLTSSSLLFSHHFLELVSDKFYIIAPDLRGHGNSSYDKPIKSIDDLVEDIKLFLDSLKITKLSILGCSIGGGIAMKFAEKYPEYVEKIILCSSIGPNGVPIYKTNEQGAPTTERAETKEEVLEDCGVKAMREAIEEQDREKAWLLIISLFFTGRKEPSAERMENFVDDFLKCKAVGDIHFAMNKFSLNLDLIKCKVLILYGGQDMLVKREDRESMMKGLGGLAELKVFEDAGHMILEDCPEESIKCILDFLCQK